MSAALNKTISHDGVRKKYKRARHNKTIDTSPLFVIAVREREELRVVGDQVGSPTWSYMIALATSQIVAESLQSPDSEFIRERSGIYHLSAAGSCSWFDFAKEIVRNDPRASEHKCKTVTCIPSSDYPTPAKRPANSILSNEKCYETFGIRLPDWKHQLAMVQVGM